MKVSIYILRIFDVTIPTRFIATAVIKWKMKIKYAFIVLNALNFILYLETAWLQLEYNIYATTITNLELINVYVSVCLLDPVPQNDAGFNLDTIFLSNSDS